MQESTEAQPEGDVLKQANLIRIRVQLPLSFSPSAPIARRELFAGRFDQMRQIISTISQVGQHAILFGERGVGKTSLANTVHEFWIEQFKDAEILVPLRVNCDTTDDFASVWHKVLEAIQVIFTQRGWHFDDQDPIVARAIQQISVGAASPDSARRLLELSSKWFIVTIDEFDRLRNAEAVELFADTIKTLSDHGVRSTLILVGVADNVDELIADHQSIDRALVQVQMPRMSANELREVVTKGLDKVGMTITKTALNAIANISQGLPHYTHLLGLNAGYSAVDRKSTDVNMEDVSSAVRMAVDNAQQSVQGAYLRAIASPQRSLFPDVLLACAIARVDDAGFFAPSDVKGPMSVIMGKSIEIRMFARHLHKLCAENRGSVLAVSGPKGRHRFRFIDPLFTPYIVLRGMKDGRLDPSKLELGPA